MSTIPPSFVRLVGLAVFLALASSGCWFRAGAGDRHDDHHEHDHDHDRR
jgi:hypothetical protein